MASKHSNALSPYPSGSLNELLVISLPLMLVAFSTQFMLFCDRMILTSYSTLAMSSACNAGTLFSSFQMVMISIAGIAEIFVGQFNGLKKYKFIGIPVWQMIWFSLAAGAFLIPLGITIAPYVVAQSFRLEGLPYFNTLILFLPLQGIAAALTSFFIGRGHVTLITTVTIIGDLINIILDIILIYGVEGYIPSMGVKGSAIATNIAQSVIVLTLFFYFLQKKNIHQFATNRLKYNDKFMKGCLKLGIPSAAAHFIEYMAWTLLFVIVSWESDDHAMILAIGQSIFLVFQFMSEGLSKAMTAVVSNFIGRGKKKLIPKSLKSAFFIHIFIMAIVAIPTFIFPEEIAKIFIKNVTYEQFITMKKTIHQSLAWIWIYLLIDGFVWVIIGVLTAGGDTLFILIASVISVWFAAILPAYLIVEFSTCSLSVSWKITAFFGLMNLLIYGWRYLSGNWIHLNLSQESQVKHLIEGSK
jgi:MATE family multidrug resistance protein